MGGRGPRNKDAPSSPLLAIPSLGPSLLTQAPAPATPPMPSLGPPVPSFFGGLPAVPLSPAPSFFGSLSAVPLSPAPFSFARVPLPYPLPPPLSAVTPTPIPSFFGRPPPDDLSIPPYKGKLGLFYDDPEAWEALFWQRTFPH